MEISATELKNRLGRYLDIAEREPVDIKKSGRYKAVLMSFDHYQALLKAAMQNNQNKSEEAGAGAA